MVPSNFRIQKGTDMKSLPAHFAGTSFMVFLMLSLSILASGCGGGGWPAGHHRR